MEYRIDDRQLDVAIFIAFVNKVWPGKYDEGKTAAALSNTLNITAYYGETLVGCLRILTDGYFFGTITEILVLPDHQRQGIGSRLLQLARKILRQCCISERSRMQRNSMKETVARRDFNPIQ